jgi:hypothetical protein
VNRFQDVELDFVLPNLYHAPAEAPEPLTDDGIASAIVADFFAPVDAQFVDRIRRVIAVPEIAVNEYRYARAREYDVGAAGQRFTVYTDPGAQTNRFGLVLPSPANVLIVKKVDGGIICRSDKRKEPHGTDPFRKHGPRSRQRHETRAACAENAQYARRALSPSRCKTA